jgi:hypothetical protein
MCWAVDTKFCLDPDRMFQNVKIRIGILKFVCLLYFLNGLCLNLKKSNTMTYYYIYNNHLEIFDQVILKEQGSDPDPAPDVWIWIRPKGLDSVIRLICNTKNVLEIMLAVILKPILSYDLNFYAEELFLKN